MWSGQRGYREQRTLTQERLVIWSGVGRLFWKGPDSTYFRLYKSYSACCNYSLLLLQHSSKRGHRTNGWQWSNKTLFTDTEIRISYNFHTSQNLLIFFQPFENIKTILSSGATVCWDKVVQVGWDQIVQDTQGMVTIRLRQSPFPPPNGKATPQGN